MNDFLIYPDHPDFQYYLSLPPPSYNYKTGLVADCQTGILREVNKAQFFDYAYGGEYDERLLSIEDEQQLNDGEEYFIEL